MKGRWARRLAGAVGALLVLGSCLFPLWWVTVASVPQEPETFAHRLLPRHSTLHETSSPPLITTVAGVSTGLIGGLLLLAANPLLATTTGRLLQALGIGCVTVALLALLRVLVLTLRRLREGS